MRNWKVTSPKAAEQRLKNNARDYARQYKYRGKLIQKPCEVCGDAKSQMHHDDYSKPLDVRWFCRRHHLDHHMAHGPVSFGDRFS